MVFFFQAEDGIRDRLVTGVQTCALPIYPGSGSIMGGIGVSGLAAQEDEDLAKIGLKAMKI